MIMIKKFFKKRIYISYNNNDDWEDNKLRNDNINDENNNTNDTDNANKENKKNYKIKYIIIIWII